MALIVLKFGGSSLAGPERLLHVANRITACHRDGNAVIAVLSARGDTTDRLLEEAHAIYREAGKRETDFLLSVGEQISVAHMALQLRALGCPAVALTGWQAGIHTDDHFGDARIRHIDGSRIRTLLAEGNVVLVTGFQGVSEGGDITTLGRGGSDTTAVGLAAFLRADACRIYTDVDGVYTADPRILPEARKLDAISYDDMLEMAALGAKVLHDRSVELAGAHNLTFEVLSSFSDLPGTVVGPQKGRRFCGVAVKKGIQLPVFDGVAARVSIIGSGCREEEAAIRLLRALGSFRLIQIARQKHSLSAYVPESEAAEAARVVHSLFLS